MLNNQACETRWLVSCSQCLPSTHFLQNRLVSWERLILVCAGGSSAEQSLNWPHTSSYPIPQATQKVMDAQELFGKPEEPRWRYWRQSQCVWVATALHPLLGAEFFPHANLSAQQVAFQDSQGAFLRGHPGVMLGHLSSGVILGYLSSGVILGHLSSRVILGSSWSHSGTPFLWGHPETPFKYGNEHLKRKGWHHLSHKDYFIVYNKKMGRGWLIPGTMFPVSGWVIFRNPHQHPHGVSERVRVQLPMKRTIIRRMQP